MALGKKSYGALAKSHSRGRPKGYYKPIEMPRGRFTVESAVERVCERCGQTFTVRLARNRKVCYQCVDKALEPKPCAICGETMRPTDRKNWKAYEQRTVCAHCARSRGHRKDKR